MASLSIPSPVGPLRIDEKDGKIVAVSWTDQPSERSNSPVLADAARQLEEYFAGKRRHFELSLAPEGTPFEERVWAAMQKIPYGETRSYGELAHEVGSAPRAVGRAIGKNPIPIVIPCHRVLAKAGPGGYSGEGGLKTKTHLLALEGLRLT
jgi:methylated-DNA-[protein]-cysteine S-methyltransferase